MPTNAELRKQRTTLRQRVDAIQERIRRITRRIKLNRERRGLPNWLPTKHADYWRKPWTVPKPSDKAVTFKQLIWEHGYASPNFTRKEAGGTLRHPQGCPVPESLRKNCQYHAFSLERVRHELGDKTMVPLSWYRCPPHNAAVGGASASQHMQANATDWGDSTRAALGYSRFDEAMHREFANGGRGVQGGTRQIRHVDNGPARTWSY